MLIAHFLSPVFVLASSPHASDHAIPSQTIASTPSIITILTNHLIICANIFWNPASPEPTVHSYLRLTTDPPQASSVASYCSVPSALAPLTHTQDPHGTFSVTITVVAACI